MQTAPALIYAHDILIHRPDEIASAEVIVFPGVGSFGSAMEVGFPPMLESPVPCATPAD